MISAALLCSGRVSRVSLVSLVCLGGVAAGPARAQESQVITACSPAESARDARPSGAFAAEPAPPVHGTTPPGADRTQADAVDPHVPPVLVIRPITTGSKPAQAAHPRAQDRPFAAAPPVGKPDVAARSGKRNPALLAGAAAKKATARPSPGPPAARPTASASPAGAAQAVDGAQPQAAPAPAPASAPAPAPAPVSDPDPLAEIAHDDDDPLVGL